MVGPQSRLALWMLGGAVFCVFLIAAANVTSLSFARSVARAREMAVRAALGASAGRIVRQLLTESVLLAARLRSDRHPARLWQASDLIRAFGPANLPRLNEVSLDLRVLGWALASLFWRGSWWDWRPRLRRCAATCVPPARRVAEASRRSATRRIRRALVVAEFALAIVLLVGAGLLVRSWWHVNNIDPGFRPERVLAMEFSAPMTFSIPAQRIDLYHRVLEADSGGSRCGGRRHHRRAVHR